MKLSFEHEHKLMTDYFREEVRKARKETAESLRSALRTLNRLERDLTDHAWKPAFELELFPVSGLRLFSIEGSTHLELSLEDIPVVILDESEEAGTPQEQRRKAAAIVRAWADKIEEGEAREE